MKRVVLDTNLLFSALRSNNTAFREILFSDEHIFYSSKYIIVEIFKHKERIIKGIKFDTPFVALALELDAELWTKGKKLKTELLRKGFDNFFRDAR